MRTFSSDPVPMVLLLCWLWPVFHVLKVHACCTCTSVREIYFAVQSQATVQMFLQLHSLVTGLSTACMLVSKRSSSPCIAPAVVLLTLSRHLRLIAAAHIKCLFLNESLLNVQSEAVVRLQPSSVDTKSLSSKHGAAGGLACHRYLQRHRCRIC